MVIQGKTKGLRIESLHMFGSVHNGDYDGVVRIFIGFSCGLLGFFILHYMEQFLLLPGV